MPQRRPQSPPPKGDQYPGIDEPGHPTRLVGAQQAHKVLHSAAQPACSWLRRLNRFQTSNHIPRQLEHISLPHELTHEGVRAKQLLVLLPQVLA